MKKSVVGLVGGVVVFLSGCTALQVDQGLREQDLRQTIYEYVNTETYIDLPTVQRNFFIHRDSCEVNYEFKKDPMQVHFATVIYGPAGTTDLKDQVMLDLTAYATGKLGIKGYAYYADNKQLARQLVQVLSKPTVCPEGISTKIE